MPEISKVRCEVVGHQIESESRVIHILRSVAIDQTQPSVTAEAIATRKEQEFLGEIEALPTPTPLPMPTTGPQIVGTPESILPDGTIVEIVTTYEVITPV